MWRLGTGPWRSYRIGQLRQSREVPIIVLFYHRIANTHPNDWSIDFATFRQQIEWMSDRFDMISLEEVQRRIRSGCNDRPAVSITFDDGYAENCEQGLPFLIEKNVPVTYFVTTEHTTKQIPFPHDVDEGIPLPVNSIESLKALANAGVEIGAHTRTHPDIGAIKDAAGLFDEIVSATREMESLINRKMRYFAFPFGQYVNLNVDAFELIRQAGFEGVCSAYGGWNDIGGGDPFHIQRIHGDPDMSRMKNWLTYDHRIAKTVRYDYSPSASSIDWRPWLDGSKDQAASIAVNHADQSTAHLEESSRGTE